MAIVRQALGASVAARSSSILKDELLTNCFPEIKGNSSYVLRRFGYEQVNTYTAAPAGGIFTFLSDPVTVIGDQARLADTTLGTVDNTSPYQFTTTGAATGFVLKNNSAAYVYNGTAAAFTKITDPNYPAVTVPGVGYIDGFTCVLTPAGRLYNTDVNAFTINALNFVSTEASDLGVAVARYLEYIVAFGQTSTTFFYNADNSTGSPFLPYKSATLSIGCAVGTSVVQTKNTLFWIGQDKQKGRSVYTLNGLSPQVVSTPYIDRILAADNLSQISAYYIELDGHGLYLLTLRSSNLTLVFDTQSSKWVVWSSSALGVTRNVVSSSETDGQVFLSIPGHGYVNGTIGLVSGSAGAEFLGTFIINVIDKDTISYTPSEGSLKGGINNEEIDRVEVNADNN